MALLLESGVAADVTFKVEDEEMKVHRIILQVSSVVLVWPVTTVACTSLLAPVCPLCTVLPSLVD